MHALLVEPKVYSRYPPLGLLKIAAYHRNTGDSVELIKGCEQPKQKPDLIYVTSSFTWTWNVVWDTVNYYKKIYPNVDLWLGGIYASLMPEHAKKSGADHICTGLFQNVDELLPAYDLVPEWNGSIIQSSRGCNRKCPYCAVWRVEGKINSTKKTIKNLIHPGHKRIILWDNNILQSKYWPDIFDELIWFSEEYKMKIDFNQGLDARLIDDRVAEKIAKMRFICVRISYDNQEIKGEIENAIEILRNHGIKGRRVCVYMLFNYLDKPDDLFERIRDVLNLGAVALPLRYQPLNTLEYNKYVGPKWDKERLELFSHFRRVCGFGGVFPPYKWLVERFNVGSSFDEVFISPERKETPINRAHKDYYGSWRRIEDWKVVTNQFLAKKW